MRRLCLVVALLAVAACTTTPAERATEIPSAMQMAALEARILELILEERARIDADAKHLATDPVLVAAARHHSRDMAEKGYFEHKGPDGQSTASYILANDATFRGLLGENIASQNYAPGAGIDVEAFAKRFVESWIESPPHRQNLAFKLYDRTGIGVAASANAIFVTQLFATDLGIPLPQTVADTVPAPTPRPASAPTPLPNPGRL